MKIKTIELTGAALDWAVGTAKGHKMRLIYEGVVGYEVNDGGFPCIKYRHYSTDWAQGGPIIEREQIAIVPLAFEWEAQYEDDRMGTCDQHGPPRSSPPCAATWRPSWATRWMCLRNC